MKVNIYYFPSKSCNFYIISTIFGENIPLIRGGAVYRVGIYIYILISKTGFGRSIPFTILDSLLFWKVCLRVYLYSAPPQSLLGTRSAGKKSAVAHSATADLLFCTFLVVNCWFFEKNLQFTTILCTLNVLTSSTSSFTCCPGPASALCSCSKLYFHQKFG